MEDDKQVFKNKAREFEGIYEKFLFKIGELRKKQTEIIENYMVKLKEIKMEEIRNQIRNYQSK